MLYLLSLLANIGKFFKCSQYLLFSSSAHSHSEADNKDTLFNLQHYKPGGGYKVWHHERDAYAVQNRMLVFMTFLNTVTDQGGTEFKYQKRIVNAEKGLTVFWPTDYTHIHRGVVSPTQDKYIATGWYHFRGPFEFQDENGEKRIFDGRNIR